MRINSSKKKEGKKKKIKQQQQKIRIIKESERRRRRKKKKKKLAVLIKRTLSDIDEQADALKTSEGASDVAAAILACHVVAEVSSQEISRWYEPLVMPLYCIIAPDISIGILIEAHEGRIIGSELACRDHHICPNRRVRRDIDLLIDRP